MTGRPPPPSKKCRICGRDFRGFYKRDPIEVCQRCAAKLPKCGCCHIIIAPEYGYMERFARQVGRYRLCYHCSRELRRKKFLRISESLCLLPSGKVKVITSQD